MKMTNPLFMTVCLAGEKSVEKTIASNLNSFFLSRSCQSLFFGILFLLDVNTLGHFDPDLFAGVDYPCFETILQDRHRFSIFINDLFIPKIKPSSFVR